MSIVMNERKRAEGIIASMTLGENQFEDLAIVAKYYYYIEKKKKKEIQSALERLLLRCVPSANMSVWDKRIEKITSSLGRYRLLEIDSIPITYGEMDTAKKMPTLQTSRLLFTLICLAKLSNEIHQSHDNWVNRDDGEIFRLANVITSIKRRGLLLKSLRDNGYISFGKRVDNMNIRVDCLDYKSDPCLHISDYRNLGNQYMMYSGLNTNNSHGSVIGMQYMPCEQCGLVVKRTGVRQKFCKDCAVKINIENTIENTKKRKMLS